MADSASPAPRPAATVVILRGEPGQIPRVLMVRRSARSPFMPNTYVFPGGRVDPGESGADEDARFEAAARRETAEEVNLGIDQVTLHWFDTWITPSGERRRYHARFFVAPVAADVGDQVQADGHETHDETWDTAQAFLARWEAGDIDLPPPTLATLLRLRGRTRQQALSELTAHDPRPPILPKWTAGDGTITVHLPHAPTYADLPGESAPAPDRVSVHPRQFRREETRWVPVD